MVLNSNNMNLLPNLKQLMRRLNIEMMMTSNNVICMKINNSVLESQKVEKIIVDNNL
jgi:hypothetical protein